MHQGTDLEGEAGSEHEAVEPEEMDWSNMEEVYLVEDDTDSEEDYDEGSEDEEERPSLEEDMGIMELVARTHALMHGAFPYPQHGDLDVQRIRRAIEDLLEATIGTGTRQDAGTWGRDENGEEWEFRQEDIDRDEDLVGHHGNIEAAARARWTELDEAAGGRLNETRVHEWITPSNPEFDRMWELGRQFGGVEVLRPNDFIPNGTDGGILPSVSGLTREVAGAMRRMIGEGCHAEKLCFVLSLDAARRLVPNMHVCTCTWAPKDGKKCGRFCNNCRNGGRQPTNQSLNSDWLREAARLHWGVINHPTIDDIVKMIDSFRERARSNGNGHRRISIWKMDLRGAYTLLTFRAEDVHLMGCLLPKDLVAFFTGGTFGWGAMPFAFQVVTRTIDWELNRGVQHKLLGESLMYVDDIIGVSFEDDVEQDQATVTTLVEGVLGIGAIADKKTVRDVNGVIEAIGYKIDHVQNRVGISDKNVKKAFEAAYAIREGVAVTTSMVQRVASHSSRYRRVVPLMAPFCKALHSACKGHTQPHVRFDLTDKQRLAVWMMQILLILTVVEGKRFTRTFASFVGRDAASRWVAEYDASLEGIAIIWFLLRGTLEVAVGCAAVSLESLGLKVGSSMMNTVEFIAATVEMNSMNRN